jgi:hypothetical protein
MELVVVVVLAASVGQAIPHVIRPIHGTCAAERLAGRRLSPAFCSLGHTSHPGRQRPRLRPRPRSLPGEIAASNSEK